MFALLSTTSTGWAASTVLNTNGFEGYNASAVGVNLAGQPTGGQAGSWFEASSSNPLGSESTAVVQTGVSNPFPGSTKTVRVDRKAGDDAYWAVTSSSFPVPNNDLIVIEWDMRVEFSQLTAGFGPAFGMFAFDGGSSAIPIGSVSVDAFTGEILYQETGTGNLTPIDPALGILVDDQWHQYRVALDYTNNAYQVMYDGQLIATESFVSSSVTAFTDADIAAIAAGGDQASQDAEGTAFFDNFVVANFDRLPGDYDVDGNVDTNDYLVWQASYGSATVAGVGADGNGDGVVDAADYTVWRDNEGAALSPSAGSTAAPEPAGLALLGLSLVAFGVRCRS